MNSLRRHPGHLFLIVFLGAISLLGGSPGHAEADPIAKVLERYRGLLLDEAISIEDKEAARTWVETLQVDGTWSDLDYQSSAKDQWPTRFHLARALQILRIRNRGEAPSGESQRYFEAALSALENWAEHRYQSPNWYWNEIGTPRLAADTLVVLGDEAPSALREKLLPVVNQFDIKGTSANLVWSASIGFHYGCLTQNRALMDSAVRRVWEEVTIGGFEGIQIDGSFFQHQERLQNFTYGKGFINEVVNLAWQLRDSPWAMPEEKQAIINTYLLDGTQWLLRGRFNSPLGIDRAISQPGAYDLRSDFRSILKNWIEISATRQDELKAFLEHQTDPASVLEGFRYFTRGDAAAYHTPEGTIFLKTVSDRTHLTESFIGLNLLGWKYLNCGDHYIFRDGTEYEGLQPVWRWDSLPGVTTPAYWSDQVRGRFVGGLEFDEGGCAAMDYMRTGELGYLQVRKFWAFHHGVMVALLGGWDFTTFWGQITTGVEQARFRGPVTISKNGRIETIAPAEGTSHASLQVDWVLHEGIGYYFLNPAESKIQAGPYSGDWRQINRDLSPEIVVQPVLAVGLEHRHEPKPTGYAIVLGADAEKMAALQKATPWIVLRNDSVAQALRFEDGTTMAVIYETPVPVTIEGVTFDRPCIASWKDGELVISEPTHRGGEINVTIDGVRHTLTLPANGTSVKVQLENDFQVRLPSW